MTATDKIFRLLVAPLLGLLLLPQTAAYGQITFDLSDVQNLVNQERTVRTFETENTVGIQALVNTSGANQTWDFTSLSYAETQSGTVEIVPLPADVPGADNPAFANATHVQIISFTSPNAGPDSTAWSYQAFDAEGIYNYGIFFESSQDIDGDGNVPDEVVFSYSPPYQTTAFPLTAGTQWTSAAMQTFEVAGQSFTTDVSLDAEVDGYGTLITPAGSAPCLRIRNTTTTTSFGVSTTFTGFQFITKAGLTAFISVDASGQPVSASYQVEGNINTDTERIDASVPTAFQLDANYPNPFTTHTTIRYTLPSTQQVTLTVYDLLGRPLKRLLNRQQPPGTYEATFDAAGLPGGTYIYRLDTPSFTQTRTMVLIK